MKTTLPSYGLSAFNCPNCGAFAKQNWYVIGKVIVSDRGSSTFGHIMGYSIVECVHCSEHSIWVANRMVYPFSGTAPLPNQDLPDDIKSDFNEARNICELSPRGSAALLRLVIQKLCVHLGESGKNINHDIGELVKKGLPITMQKALDAVRVIGNNAVHPGVIDLADNIEVSRKLFAFVNVIADVMITQPNEIEKFYNDQIPEDQKEAIKKRDSK
jgi:endogenous inhibitor of DNA gyrase (YacG/DUF329 family)